MRHAMGEASLARMPRGTLRAQSVPIVRLTAQPPGLGRKSPFERDDGFFQIVPACIIILATIG